MTKRRQALGREGEERAARYLETRGYRIVARNVRAGRVEMDLIATPPRSSRTCVIIEVKTRHVVGALSGERHAEAAEAVDREKRARLRRGGLAWLAESPRPGPPRRGTRLRFDVVTCLCRRHSMSRPPRMSGRCDRGMEGGRIPAAAPQAFGSSDGRDAPPPNRRASERIDEWSIRHWESAF